MLYISIDVRTKLLLVLKAYFIPLCSLFSENYIHYRSQVFRMRRPIVNSYVSALLLRLPFVTAGTTGECAPVTWMPDGFIGPEPSPLPPENFIKHRPIPQPGEINCRAEFETDYDPKPDTCIKACEKYGITLEKLFLLNPGLEKDCSNIQPNTEYCYAGFIEPLRAFDGLCGPKHKNATCIGTAAQCCNAMTWTCGNSKEDCAPGNCYEGACGGDKIYSTDGTCGHQHRDRLCAGRWGDCCNLDGKCGIGDDFCGGKSCQSGKCQRPAFSNERIFPWLTGNTPDGSCGGELKFTCNTVYGNCCNKDGRCGSLPEDCGEGCQPEFGKCGTIPPLQLRPEL